MGAANVQLQPYHVVSLREDISVINEALATLSKKQGRRATKQDWQTKFGMPTASTASEVGQSSTSGVAPQARMSPGVDYLVIEGRRCKVSVERTFVNVQLSSSSAKNEAVCARSAPAPF